MIITSLSQSVSGTVIARADPRYDAACDRLLWNLRKPERDPALIVRARSTSDVQAVVRYARARGLRVSPRGGGHNWSGIALQSGIVLDLSMLGQLSIDAGARTAEAGPGVTNRALARALARHGLAFPVGHCGTVPLSGYLLGGGLGWNMGAWGIACFAVESLEVVTAEGEIRHVSAHENRELFWAARGGGPEFFGVVTKYRLRLQPLPRAITTSVWTFDLDEIGKVADWMSELTPRLPRNVEFTVLMSGARPGLAARAAKVATAAATVFADTDGEARAVLARIAATAPGGALSAEQNLATPFETLFDIMATFLPDRRRYAADDLWSAARPGDVVETLAGGIRRAPSPDSVALVAALHPHAADLPDAAFSVAAPVFGAFYAVWRDAAGDEANLRWLRETASAVGPLANGHYVGEADLESGRLRTSFSPAAWARLDALRAKYDPAGVFDNPSNPNRIKAA